MSLEVTQRPIFDNTNWFGVKTPIVYRLQRKDFTFNQVNNNSSDIQLQFNAVNISAQFTPGDVLYIKSDNDEYDLFAEVKASTFSTNTLVTVDAPYTSTAPGGFANNTTSRRLYRVEINLYDIDDILLNDSPFRYNPNTKGAIIADVSSVVRQFVSPLLTFDFAGSEVQVDSGIYQGFYIGYKEVWAGSSEAEVDDDSNPVYGILGGIPIPSATGASYEDYLLGEDGTKLLTKLEILPMWRGYPLLLSAIVNDQTDVYFATNTDSTTPLTTDNEVLTVDLNEVITDQTPDNESVTVYVDGSTPNDISDTLPITLKDACRNPVMLIGRNSLGGHLQWLFDGSQEYTFDYGGGVKAKRLVLVAERITINEWEALQDFISLGEVYRENIIEITTDTNATTRRVGNQVYVIEPDGSMTGVIVIPTRNTTSTRKIKHRFEIEIEYPSLP
jgi:hypothetical protein